MNYSYFLFLDYFASKIVYIPFKNQTLKFKFWAILSTKIFNRAKRTHERLESLLCKIK